MLSIRSLTAELISDPALVLNNAELSRVRLMKGSKVGEFFVDVNIHPDGLQFGVIDIRRQSINEPQIDKECQSDDGLANTVPRLGIGSPV